MKFKLLIILITLSLSLSAQNYYYPERSADWKIKSATEVGIDANLLKKAVDFAEANEYSGSRDLRIAILKGFASEPYHKILGKTKKRGGPAGMILKNGYVIAQWGDVKRVDMTFSVTKSYLSTVAGVAYDQGLIKSVTDKVEDYVWDRTFEGEHNSKIEWRHLLTQSSDWYGQLWGGYDWADRPPREGGIDDWKFKKLFEPGTKYKYNDVRVNVLAYSLLQVWRKPLPVILKAKIMDPIGASSTWRWYGYNNSFTLVDGLNMQSVSGGGHSGGGVFINTEDHARFGLLFLSKGRWNGKQLISKEWIELATESSPANKDYGFMWWLNKTNSRMTNLSNNAFYAAGFGGNYIIIEPDHDLVIVTRWLEPSKANEFVKLVKDSFK